MTSSYTRSGTTIYQQQTLSVDLKLLQYFILSAQIPYKDVRGKDIRYQKITAVSGEELYIRDEFSYHNEGIGDISVIGMVSITDLLRGKVDAQGNASETSSEDSKKPPKKPDKPGEGPEKEKKCSKLFAGFGFKFPTGDYGKRDLELFNYDYGKNITGEYDKSMGVIPSTFQIGTGTLDLIAAISYKTHVRDFPVYFRGTYVHPMGENSYGYERKDRYSITSGIKFEFSEEPGLCLSTGPSALWIPREDVDHSENTELLGSQEVGRVDGTDGFFLFLDAGLTLETADWLSFTLSSKLPLYNSVDSTENAFDYQFSLGLTLKF